MPSLPSRDEAAKSLPASGSNVGGPPGEMPPDSPFASSFGKSAMMCLNRCAPQVLKLLKSKRNRQWKNNDAKRRKKTAHLRNYCPNCLDAKRMGEKKNTRRMRPSLFEWVFKGIEA